jgi:hypothetical protein
MSHKHNGKAAVGPGGISCSCCTKGDRQYHKKLAKAQTRREIKAETIKEVVEVKNSVSDIKGNEERMS